MKPKTKTKNFVIIFIIRKKKIVRGSLKRDREREKGMNK